MIQRLARVFFLLVLIAAGLLPAQAVQPDEILKDTQLEQRARSLSAELRCLVCQNQSIDDSDAPLARDLRVIVRERLQAGDSDQEIIDFVVDRYGEFILLRPRLTAKTYLLWLAPILIFAAGLLLARRLFLTRRSTVQERPAPLSAEEAHELRSRLSQDGRAEAKDAMSRPSRTFS